MKLLPFIFPVLLLLSGSFADARSSPFAQPKLVKVPGTKVSLVPPPGFNPTERFPGFGDEETRSSIMITEMPAPYSEMAKAMTKEAWAAKGEPLATKGMTMLSRKEISLNGRPGILLHVRQEVTQGVPLLDVLKWIVVTGNEKETVMIIATFPEFMKDRRSSEMEKSVLSAQWDVEAKIDPLADLNFSFTDDPSLKFAGRMSNAVVLTKDGTSPGKPNNDPLFIIGSSVSAVIIPDVKEYAEKRLMLIEKVSGITIKKQSNVTIAGLPGSEIIAEAQQQRKDLPDTPVTIYQVILLDEKGGYFLMQGFAPREEQEKYLANFTRIAQSFRKK